jgi:hypothetical protein
MDGEACGEGRGSCAVEHGNDGESWLVRKNGAERAQRRREEEICFAARRTGTEHAETREGFEFERVVSCGSGDRWWRTKLDFGRGEPLDDYHRSATLGAAPKVM